MSSTLSHQSSAHLVPSPARWDGTTSVLQIIEVRDHRVRLPAVRQRSSFMLPSAFSAVRWHYGRPASLELV